MGRKRIHPVRVPGRPLFWDDDDVLRGVLCGAVTSTRRLIKPQPPEWATSFGWSRYTPKGYISGRGELNGKTCEVLIKTGWTVGKKVWVREAFAGEEGGRLIYRADGGPTPPAAWCSAMYAPRWSSRCTLLIEALRVERLQAIAKASTQEWAAEGCPLPLRDDPAARVEWFREKWDELHAESGHAWATDPVVRVLTFKRVEP